LTKIDILNYYRKLIEKSRSFFREHLNVRKLKKPIEKVKSFCAAHLNLKPIDIFLVIAVIMALVYIIVNRSCGVVNELRHIKRINIVISSQGVNLFGKDTVDALIQEFESLNPELRIQEATAADDSADIVFFDDSEFGNLMNASILASPDSYRPLVSFMDIFIYNIDILKAANLDRPPKTRAEFLAAARAVAESDTGSESPVSAFALGLSPADPLALRRDFYPWIWASGVDIHSIDISEDNPALPRPVTDAIALFGELNREGLLAPGTFEKTGAERLQEFAEGKIAMMTISARDIAYLLNSSDGITLGITALPATAQGKNRLALSSVYAGISGASAVPDEAGIFLSFLVEKSNALAEALSAIPAHLTVGFAGEYIEKSELYSKAWDIFEAADIVDYKPGEPSEEEFNRLIREKLVEAFE
jgi:ABC-type glycerol-3-phosphate transport system substrate-binding protein